MSPWSRFWEWYGRELTAELKGSGYSLHHGGKRVMMQIFILHEFLGLTGSILLITLDKPMAGIFTLFFFTGIGFFASTGLIRHLEKEAVENIDV